ncbi:putative nonribosomal peptide synthetase [Mycobacterium xenopi 3993]|nr:putative nonribosomal peptide synthetase [Mycobacterium xenopi 3993]
MKVRGYRIEVAEVVSALSASPGVAGAAVIPVRGATGTRLLGFVTADGDAVDVAAVRAHIARRLPAYMVPARIIAVDAMPLTPHGKLDTEALLAAAGDPPEPGAGAGRARPPIPSERWRPRWPSCSTAPHPACSRTCSSSAWTASWRYRWPTRPATSG